MLFHKNFYYVLLYFQILIKIHIAGRSFHVVRLVDVNGTIDSLSVIVEAIFNDSYLSFR